MPNRLRQGATPPEGLKVLGPSGFAQPPTLPGQRLQHEEIVIVKQETSNVVELQ